jgi:hypothetical protein
LAGHPKQLSFFTQTLPLHKNNILFRCVRAGAVLVAAQGCSHVVTTETAPRVRDGKTLMAPDGPTTDQ